MKYIGGKRRRMVVARDPRYVPKRHCQKETLMRRKVHYFLSTHQCRKNQTLWMIKCREAGYDPTDYQVLIGFIVGEYAELAFKKGILGYSQALSTIKPDLDWVAQMLPKENFPSLGPLVDKYKEKASFLNKWAGLCGIVGGEESEKKVARPMYLVSDVPLLAKACCPTPYGLRNRALLHVATHPDACSTALQFWVDSLLRNCKKGAAGNWELKLSRNTGGYRYITLCTGTPEFDAFEDYMKFRLTCGSKDDTLFLLKDTREIDNAIRQACYFAGCDKNTFSSGSLCMGADIAQYAEGLCQSMNKKEAKSQLVQYMGQKARRNADVYIRNVSSVLEKKREATGDRPSLGMLSAEELHPEFPSTETIGPFQKRRVRFDLLRSPFYKNDVLELRKALQDTIGTDEASIPCFEDPFDAIWLLYVASGLMHPSVDAAVESLVEAFDGQDHMTEIRAQRLVLRSLVSCKVVTADNFSMVEVPSHFLEYFRLEPVPLNYEQKDRVYHKYTYNVPQDDKVDGERKKHILKEAHKRRLPGHIAAMVMGTSGELEPLVDPRRKKRKLF